MSKPKDDLISRVAAIEAVKRLHGGCITNDVKNFVEYQILSVPAVDAVPVVRCKGCMYFRPWRHDRGDDSRCEFWNTEMGAEDYCSQAIYLNNRRDEDVTLG